MLTPLTNMPRREETTTSFSASRILSASRIGVRPSPSSVISTASCITAPGGIWVVMMRSLMRS